MFLIVYFYSQLLKSIRSHEKMLRDQVSGNVTIMQLLGLACLARRDGGFDFHDALVVWYRLRR